MPFRHFAERVLWGTSLEEKLQGPTENSDIDRGAPLAGLVTPSRPPGLGLAGPDTPRVAFPRLAELDDEWARGRVLHFFANHELLALELMALALLRFPDAPPAFRQRLVVTMRDEQRHMKLYLDRMAELGIELGEIPLNSFFWDLLSKMERPMDFVVGMSLTFEQANLDYSCHYRDAFQKVGDEATGEIMERVLVDEVAHVRHGVYFFNQWRAAGRSQWEAYQSELNFPITPARAKGLGFTITHRRDAGLDEDFIDRLRVYSHSKGRPPRVFVFNPGTELALGVGERSYTPPRPVLNMTRDLELLPMFLMAREDALLVRREPDAEHLRRLMDKGYPIPEFIIADLDKPRLSTDTNLSRRKLAELVPWGWDPSIAAFFEPLAQRMGEPPVDLQARVEKRARLASKAWLAERVPSLIREIPEELRGKLVTKTLPTVARTLDEARAGFATHRNAGYEHVVFKAPYGTAGHAAIRGREDRLKYDEERWIEETIAAQGAVTVEPWYRRELDLSYLFEVRPDRSLREAGFSRFFTDARGGYRGAVLGPLSLGVPDAARRFIFRGADGYEWLRRTAHLLAAGLLPYLNDTGFSGLAGMDMMVIRDIDGQLKLRAPLELNPRPTMGHVALGLRRPLKSRAVGLWLLMSPRDLQRTGSANFTSLMGRLSAALPFEFAGSPPCIRQGAFSTNEVARANQTASVMLVSPDLDGVLSALSSIGLESPLLPTHLNR